MKRILSVLAVAAFLVAALLAAAMPAFAAGGGGAEKFHLNWGSSSSSDNFHCNAKGFSFDVCTAISP